MSDFKTLDCLISSDIYERVKLLQRITRCVRTCLPAQMARHCWVGGYDRERLQLVTDHNSFATPIYYRQKEIMHQVHKQFGKELNIQPSQVTVSVSRYPIEKHTH